MNPVYDFKGQVALVTGASSGIGLATAKAFAEAGAAVVLVDINEKALRAATGELISAGHRAIGVTCNVADEAQVAAMVKRTVATFGKLDMAFNNAGILGPVGDLTDETSGAFDDVTAVNLRGVWTCMKHELLQMRTHRYRPLHLPHRRLHRGAEGAVERVHVTGGFLRRADLFVSRWGTGPESTWRSTDPQVLVVDLVHPRGCHEDRRARRHCPRR